MNPIGQFQLLALPHTPDPIQFRSDAPRLAMRMPKCDDAAKPQRSPAPENLQD